jgi:hypothetical protein
LKINFRGLVEMSPARTHYPDSATTSLSSFSLKLRAERSATDKNFEVFALKRSRVGLEQSRPHHHLIEN